MTDSLLPALPPGQIIGERYRVVRQLGGGGMGMVFEVEHVALGRPFALKVLRAGERGEELVQRFDREARALAKMRSARVAQVTDFGIEAGLGPYYVMELVEGGSLQERLDAEGKLPIEEVMLLGAELCEALAEVHAAGLVHRDLKPGNIGVPADGPVRIKLLDFGLATAMDDSFLTRITQSHQVLGSLPYISPEQFAGARPDPQQDLWSLGVVLYEMAEGRLPFDAPSTAALMHKILTAPVPPLEALPPALGQVIGMLLQKEPSDRPRDAKAVAALLRGKASQLPRTRETAAPHAPTVPSTEVTSGDIRRSEAQSAPTLRASVAPNAITGASELPVAAQSVPAEAPAAPRTPWWVLGLGASVLTAGLVMGGLALFNQKPDPVGGPPGPADPSVVTEPDANGTPVDVAPEQPEAAPKPDVEDSPEQPSEPETPEQPPEPTEESRPARTPGTNMTSPRRWRPMQPTMAPEPARPEPSPTPQMTPEPSPAMVADPAPPPPTMQAWTGGIISEIP